MNGFKSNFYIIKWIDAEMIVKVWYKYIFLSYFYFP